MAEAALSLDEALPGYEVEGELGRGAMGEVLSARHIRLDRQVAIKRLPVAFARDEEVRERFGAEARLLASLNHPHIVPVYDYIEQDGLCLLVMEALPKGTVWDRFTGPGLTLRTSCAVVLTTCTALSYAHEHRVLHRDIKPENLMFDAEDALKVTDFGIARMLGGEETLSTVEGAVIGTPAYMAPEQAAGRPVGPTADVYAVATMLYELASTRLPFDESGGAGGILEARLTSDPVPLLDVAPQVPPALAQVVMEALARDPADRPDSAEAFGAAVGRAATDAWGPDWITQAGIQVMASGAIARSTQRSTEAKGIPTGAATIAGGTVAGTEESARGTRVGGEVGGTEESARGTRVGGEEPSTALPTAVADLDTEFERVIGGGGLAAVRHGGDLGDIDPADFVPVHEVLSPPPVPRAAMAGTIVSVLLVLLIAFVGLGSPGRDSTLAEGQVLLNGQDLATGDTVTVDLAEQVEVEVIDLPPEAQTAAVVELRLSAAGVPLGTSSAGELSAAGQGTTAFGVRSLRVITGGELTGTLRFLDSNGDLVHQHEFALDIDQPWYQTASALLGLTILLFINAYAIAVAAPLWLGRRRRSAAIALTWLGGFAGLAVLTIGWAVGGSEPTLVSTILVVVFGAAAGAAGSWSLFRLRRRRRLLVGGVPQSRRDEVESDAAPDPEVEVGSTP